MATGKKKRSSALEIDFEGVESGGGSRAVPDGTYSVTVAGAPTKEEGQDSGEAYLSWKFKISKGKHKGVTLYDNTSLQPQALWKLKSLLEAMGEEVPDSTMRLVPSEYVDRELQGEVVNEEYNGKDRSKIVGYIVEGGEDDDGSDDDASEDESEDEDDEDEKPAKKKGKSKKSEDEDEDEDESGDEESEDDDEDEDEDEKPRGKGKRALARAAAKKKAADEDEDEDEDEEDEAPAKKKGGSSKIKKGVRVSFEDDGKTVKGKVMEVDGSVATVDVKGDEWQVQLEDLTIID